MNDGTQMSSKTSLPTIQTLLQSVEDAPRLTTGDDLTAHLVLYMQSGGQRAIMIDGSGQAFGGNDENDLGCTADNFCRIDSPMQRAEEISEVGVCGVSAAGKIVWSRALYTRRPVSPELAADLMSLQLSRGGMSGHRSIHSVKA